MKEGRRERRKYRKMVEGRKMVMGREREGKEGGGSGKRKKAVRKGREGRGESNQAIVAL